MRDGSVAGTGAHLPSAAVVGSGADFTASSANPANTFTSGTLSIENSHDASAVLTASNLKPGGAAQTGTVDIKNLGSLAGSFSLSRGAISDTLSLSPLSPKLNLTITDCGSFAGGTPVCGDGNDVTSYSGALPAMATAALPIALGTFAPAEKHTYKFSVSLDSSAGNTHQGGQTQVDFNWAAA